MGSLDVSSAKDQFFKLVDSISTAHLPSFTIWLDAKLAEYKTIGQLQPDTDSRKNEHYPEWISRSLRQNLSFILPGRSEEDNNSSSQAQSPRKPHKRRISNSSDSESPVAASDVSQKRRLLSPPDTKERLAPEQTEEQRIVLVKEEPGASETPLPGIQDAFSLTSESVPVTHDLYSQPVASLSSVGETSALGSFDVAAADVPVYRDASLQRGFGEGGSSLPPYPASLQQGFGEGGSSLPPQQALEVAKPGAYGAPFNTDAGNPTWTEELGSRRCARCGRTFRTLGLLNHHKLSNEKSNRDCKTANLFATCPDCGKGCKDNYRLKVHRLTHSGVQPYRCPYCIKSFNDLSNCYRHQRLSHPDKPRLRVKSTVVI